MPWESQPYFRIIRQQRQKIGWVGRFAQRCGVVPMAWPFWAMEFVIKCCSNCISNLQGTTAGGPINFHPISALTDLTFRTQV